MKPAKETPNTEMTDRSPNIFQKIGEWFYMLHLYSSKGEAAFKAILLFISWSGGVRSQSSVSAYYLFSIAIIMEYAVQLIYARKFIPKILPLILVSSNALVCGFSAEQLIDHIDTVHNYQFYIEMITVIIVAIDSIITISVEPPERYRIESNLIDV